MRINEANIEINRKDGKLFSISVDMPIWDKIVEDDFMSVNIPFLGIKTFARDEEDAQQAIKECINLFCISSEKFGNGLEAELKLIGWDFVSRDANSTVMAFTTSNFIFDQILQTGDKFVETLELVC